MEDCFQQCLICGTVLVRPNRTSETGQSMYDEVNSKVGVEVTYTGLSLLSIDARSLHPHYM